MEFRSPINQCVSTHQWHRRLSARKAALAFTSAANGGLPYTISSGGLILSSHYVFGTVMEATSSGRERRG